MALIDDLEREGFDTSQITPELISGLEKEGYDVSGLRSPSSAQAGAAGGEEQAPMESKARRFTRKVANALPLAGSIGVPAVAAISSGGLSLPATAGLAGVGGAGGEAAKQLILRALGDTEGVPQTMGEAAQDIGLEGVKDAALTYGGGKLFQGAGKGLRLAKDLITKPGAGEAAVAGKEALAKVGAKGAEKLALARETREAAKAGLIGAEEKAGLHFESTPGFEEMLRDPKKMAAFATKIGQLAKKTPEELAQQVDKKTLQLFRKLAQEGEKVSTLSDIAKSQMRQGKSVFSEALGVSEPEVGAQLGRFREADKVVGEIPGEIKRNLIRQKLMNEKELLEARKLDKTRRVVKGVAKAGAVYLGAKTLLK